VPEREQPLTRGDAVIDVPIEDANLLDAASSGAAMGWQLAINVAAMLIAFVALIAMVNLGMGWLGRFFTSVAGLLQFDLVVVAVVVSLFLVEIYGLENDLRVWWGLPAIALGYWLARRMAGLDLARSLALIGIGLWLPMFLRAGGVRRYGRWGYGTVAAIGVAANLAYFVFGSLTTGSSLSLQGILGFFHWPVALAMGTPLRDCAYVGRLLGEKLVLTEFVAYADLGSYLGSAARGEAPALDPRSILLASYALSGFANFASIAVQIGGIAPLAPSRRHDIARLGLKAMIGGALAGYLLASVAGVFYNGSSMLGVVK
jgi:nucleoside permease NupC